MDHLHGTRHIERVVFRRAEIGGHLDGQDRSNPFTPCEQAVTHGLVERSRIDVAIGDEFGETLVDHLTPAAGGIPLVFVPGSQT